MTHIMSTGRLFCFPLLLRSRREFGGGVVRGGSVGAWVHRRGVEFVVIVVAGHDSLYTLSRHLSWLVEEFEVDTG